MIAYVIKNKEGEYLGCCQDFETNNICDARPFTYGEALRFCPNNCKVVEITIAEGDLEQQLAEKDNEINNLKELRKFGKGRKIMEKLNEKDLKQALESKDKNVVIDFALQYKWERDYILREKEKAEKECDRIEKALDILASIFVREKTCDSDSKEERRKAKVHLVMFAKEVADYMINGSFENENETEI